MVMRIAVSCPVEGRQMTYPPHSRNSPHRKQFLAEAGTLLSHSRNYLLSVCDFVLTVGTPCFNSDPSHRPSRAASGGNTAPTTGSGYHQGQAFHSRGHAKEDAFRG